METEVCFGNYEGCEGCDWFYCFLNKCHKGSVLLQVIYYSMTSLIQISGLDPLCGMRQET